MDEFFRKFNKWYLIFTVTYLLISIFFVIKEIPLGVISAYGVVYSKQMIDMYFVIKNNSKINPDKLFKLWILSYLVVPNVGWFVNDVLGLCILIVAICFTYMCTNKRINLALKEINE